MLAESVSSTTTIWALIGSWFTPTFFFIVLNLMIGTILITSSFPNQKHQHQDSHANPLPQQLPPSPSAFQGLKSLHFNPYRSPQPPHHHSPEFHTYHIFAQTQQPQIARSPSILERLKPINPYNYFPTEPISAKLPTDTDSSVLHTTTTHPAEIRFHFHNTHEPEKHHLDPPAVESEEEREEEHDDVGQIPRTNELPQPERPIDEIYSHFQDIHVTGTKSDTTPASGEMPVKLPGKTKTSASAKSAFVHFKEDDIVENSRPATIKEAQDTAAELADDEVDAKADDFINKFKQQLKLQRLDSAIK